MTLRERRQAPAALHAGQARRAREQRQAAAAFADWIAARIESSGCSEPEAIAVWFVVFHPSEWFEGRGARRVATQFALVRSGQERLRRQRALAQNDNNVSTRRGGGRRRGDTR